MFSTLGHILRTPARHAESADSRMNIRRQDPDHHRRNTNEQESEPDLFDSEDQAHVSVEALRIFLDNYLKSAQPQEHDGMSAEHSGVEALKEKYKTLYNEQLSLPRQHTGEAKRAMNAYQAGARAGSSHPQLAGQNTANTASGAALLSSEDLRIVHGLLEDLNVLSQAGIQTLRVGRSHSFLQSLVDAAAHATKN